MPTTTVVNKMKQASKHCSQKKRYISHSLTSEFIVRICLHIEWLLRTLCSNSMKMAAWHVDSGITGLLHKQKNPVEMSAEAFKSMVGEIPKQEPKKCRQYSKKDKPKTQKQKRGCTPSSSSESHEVEPVKGDAFGEFLSDLALAGLYEENEEKKKMGVDLASVNSSPSLPPSPLSPPVLQPQVQTPPIVVAKQKKTAALQTGEPEKKKKKETPKLPEVKITVPSPEKLKPVPPPFRIVDQQNAANFTPTLSILMCKACHHELTHRSAVLLPGGRQLISFSLCPKCVEVNKGVKDVIDMACQKHT